MKISAVDLFCGVGGLTIGLESAGIPVIEGIDVEGACGFPYEHNSAARFVHKDIASYTVDELTSAYGTADITVLVGCAPCQPFSTYTQGRRTNDEEKWSLLGQFSQLIVKSKPHIVSMENVWPLTRHDAFRQFIEKLNECGYQVHYQNVDCRTYGIPQRRIRLVLLASRLGPISLIKSTHGDPTNWHTVKQTITGLRPIGAGEADPDDPLHVSSSLSETNMRRIRASLPGGSWRDWPGDLVAPCHKKDTGSTYPGVYGRMEWDKPAPTITGQCFGFGNGRFGHPQQDRAISLREAALLQTFPRDFLFTAPGTIVGMKSVGNMVGNAVPPKLGEVIAKSILAHLECANESDASILESIYAR